MIEIVIILVAIGSVIVGFAAGYIAGDHEGYKQGWIDRANNEMNMR